MPKCPVCDGEDFDLQDGLYYCTECSTQSQEIREEAVEDEYTEGTRSARVVRRARDHRGNSEVDCSPNWRMAEAYNIIVREQVHALVALGASTDFAEASLQLWAQYLKHSEQAFVTHKKSWTPRLCTMPYARDIQVAMGNAVKYRRIAASRDNTATLVKKWKSRGQKSRHDAGDTKEANEENEVIEMESGRNQEKAENRISGNIKKEEEKKAKPQGVKQSSNQDLQSRADAPDSKKPNTNCNILGEDHRFSRIALDTYKKKGPKVHVMKKGHQYRPLDALDMLTAISIPCLALRITQDTILLSDITRWIKEGHIPYLQAHRLLPVEWRIFPHEKVYFSPKVPPTVKSLHTSVRRLANFLGLLRVPVLEVRSVAARYVVDLNLPFEFLPFVNIVFEQFMSTKRSLSRMGSTLEFYAGVAILFVLKHIFGLDNKTERILSDVALKENLKNASTGGEQLFVWSEWEQQMKAVVTFVRARNPFSMAFSTEDCQDVGVVLTYIKNFGIDAEESENFSKCFQAKTVENVMFIKKSLSSLCSQNERHSQQKLEQESKRSAPINSFPIRTILAHCSTRTGQQHMDFSHRRLHSARAQTYWFCHSLDTKCANVCGGGLPSSFMLVFYVLQEILDWTLADVMQQIMELERSVFALRKGHIS